MAWGVSELSMYSTLLPRPSALSGGDLASYPRDNAFNGIIEPTTTGAWCASQTDNNIINNAWIGYDFGAGAAKAIKRVVVWNYNVPVNISYIPTSFIVESSSNCSAWNVVARVSKNSRTNKSMVLDLPASTAARCWRVRAATTPRYVDGTTTRYWCAEEIEMFE